MIVSVVLNLIKPPFNAIESVGVNHIPRTLPRMETTAPTAVWKRNEMCKDFYVKNSLTFFLTKSSFALALIWLGKYNSSICWSTECYVGG